MLCSVSNTRYFPSNCRFRPTDACHLSRSGKRVGSTRSAPGADAGYHGSFVAGATVTLPSVGSAAVVSVHASPTPLTAADKERWPARLPESRGAELWDSDFALATVQELALGLQVIAAGDWNEARAWDKTHSGHWGEQFFKNVKEAKLMDCTYDRWSGKERPTHHVYQDDHLFATDEVDKFIRRCGAVGDRTAQLAERTTWRFASRSGRSAWSPRRRRRRHAVAWVWLRRSDLECCRASGLPIPPVPASLQSGLVRTRGGCGRAVRSIRWRCTRSVGMSTRPSQARSTITSRWRARVTASARTRLRSTSSRVRSRCSPRTCGWRLHGSSTGRARVAATFAFASDLVALVEELGIWTIRRAGGSLSCTATSATRVVAASLPSEPVRDGRRALALCRSKRSALGASAAMRQLLLK